MLKVLILGGTAEAVRLSKGLTSMGAYECITSLAGRTRNPRRVAGSTRSGGFGGPQGLAAYLRQNDIDLLVDATHPFADRMARNAEAAAEVAGVPRVKLLRPAWRPESGDRWIEVDSLAQAADQLGSRVSESACWVFLTTGYQGLAAFHRLPSVRFLLRLVDYREQAELAPNFKLITDRGPFEFEEECRLLRDYSVRFVVSKNSGGTATYAKIAAARALAIPVVMVRQPIAPPGPLVETPEAVIDWIETRFASG